MSRVIKGRSSTGEMVAFNLPRVEEEAERIIAEARAKAEGFHRDAKLEVERLKEEVVRFNRDVGQKQGFEVGHREGLELGKKNGAERAYAETRQRLDQQVAPLKETLATLVKSFEQHHRELKVAAEEDLLKLALAIAEKVVMLKVVADSEALRANLSRAVGLVLDKSSMEIVIHPDDEAAVHEHLPDLARAFQDLGQVSLRPSDEVSRGGCVIRTKVGEIDARIQTQIETIAAELLGVAAPHGDVVAAAGSAASAAGPRPAGPEPAAGRQTARQSAPTAAPAGVAGATPARPAAARV
ncbi:MAG: hypothetical protein HY719_15825 [Planctomycetes bacterium]|nr:hypothetical protein [Planctomycetota bacterium]